MAREICKNTENLYVWFRINRENISNHAFCLMKLHGLKVEHYFNEIAPTNTQICIKLMPRGHKCFAGLCSLDLKNETFSRHHATINLEQFSILNAFSKILKTARRIFSLNVNHACLIMLTILFKSLISIDTLENFSQSNFNFIRQKAWFEMFLRFNRNQIYRIFLFLCISLAIHHNLRNWHQLFYNRSGI